MPTNNQPNTNLFNSTATQIDKKNVMYNTSQKIDFSKCEILKFNFCNIVFNVNDNYYELFTLLNADLQTTFDNSKNLNEFLTNVSTSKIDLKNLPLRKLTSKSISNSNYKTVKNIDKMKTTIFSEMIYNTTKIKLVANFNKLDLLLKFNAKFKIISDVETLKNVATELKNTINEKILKYAENLKKLETKTEKKENEKWKK